MQRVGQGGFRVLVMEAYNRRCAITGASERFLFFRHLILSHIVEKISISYRTDFFFDSDIHILFDAGYITVILPDLYVEVIAASKRNLKIAKDYFYALQRPSPSFAPRPAELFVLRRIA